MGLASAFKKVNDKIGMVCTVGGLLLLPFFGAAAAGNVASHAAAATVATTAATTTATVATNGGVLASFWAPLATGVSGKVGVVEGASRIWDGWCILGKSAVTVVGAGIDPTQTMAQALAAPVAG